MRKLKKQLQRQNELVSSIKLDLQNDWTQLKSDLIGKITSPHTLIWTGITGFVIGEIFRPSRRKILFTFWPVLKNIGQPLLQKFLAYFHDDQGDQHQGTGVQ
ncbi:MAG: hypothetical protein K0Q57_1034 [Gammaproteobacteria bacterium]|jgi:hypothetical protein|nr:hypothetical protein [Gammaproteobacteria bacterium]